LVAPRGARYTFNVLSPEQARAFFEDGYLVLPGTFTPEEVAAADAAFRRLEARAQQLSETALVEGSLFVVERRAERPLRIERIVWCGGAEPELGRLGRSPKLTVPASQLLGGPELDQLINQAHIKNPGDGVAFHFHQDSYHRRYGTELFEDVNGRGSFVQTLTAIDAMNADNGGLWVVPRSHRAGHIPTPDGRLPEGAFDRTAAVPLSVQAGDTILFGLFTVHGSGLNAGATPRRVFINGFCCPGANRREYPGAGTGLRLKAFPDAA
jgi:ectoine hydroxylase-related dioxygenase (phytanoyl-CoA dioxygenase family)